MPKNFESGEELTSSLNVANVNFDSDITPISGMVNDASQDFQKFN